ncbi:hypothetical protein VTL71DRAFT_6824 [Oculimacula yallundae]|uniref:Oxidase ustYa n=1 Tax=Oculimacula yallundae TaxID=86028 RepID=A0ABR4C0M3_9HELO
MAQPSYTILEQKESIQDLENHAKLSPPTIRGRCYIFIQKSLSTILKTVSLVAAVLCLSLLAGFVASKAFIWNLPPSNQPGPLPEAFFPNFGRLSLSFVNGGDFTRNDSYGDQLWDGLVPIGAGYVRVPNPRQFNLPPSEVLEDNGPGYAELYQASVVHQLHCMGVLRDYTRAYETGLPPPRGGNMHVRHCIEYLRQIILCNADTTLEQTNAEGAFTAQDAVHQCRDWNLVKAFLEENRADDATPGILGT